MERFHPRSTRRILHVERLKAISVSLLTFFISACGGMHEYASMQGNTSNNTKIHQDVQQGLNDLRAGYTDLAQEKLQQAYLANPYDPVVLDGYGYYFEKTGELNKANQYYTAALLYTPTSPQALQNYGDFLCRNGYSQESARYFRLAAAAQRNTSASPNPAQTQFCR